MTNDKDAAKATSDKAGTAPFRVLGIALVLDQLGKEARMAFRYPSGTNPSEANSKHSKSSEELFFTLSSRQMAKLFRPKRSLCGQPMTLSVGGTVFCFRAVLMGEPEMNAHQEQSQSGAPAASSSASITSTHTQSTNNSNHNHHNSNCSSDHLVLFSVIVALAPQVELSSIPISGWFEGKEDDKSDMNQSMHRLYSSTGSLCSSEGMGSHPSGSHAGALKQDSNRASASFLAIRRVQVSLARLCRVLEREEKRCRYISIQSQNFFRIRADLQKKWEEKAAGSAISSSAKPPASSSSPKADFSSKSQSAADRKKANKHRRGNSFSQGLLGGSSSVVVGDVAKDRIFRKDSIMNTADKEQEVLEHVLASGLQEEGSPSADRQHGNLGRELVQVFHALSRNDHNFPPSPSVLSGRDGVVYVNRHIAVALEAASPPKTQSPENRSNAIVRPYHTLIFPNASPSQLLQSLQSSGFTAPLQQLLLMVRPSKPLMDIAVDANLPLSVTMELANYLVSHGVCVASTVLTRATCLACKNVDRIQTLGLDFSQTFDDWSVSPFLVVSFLTANGRTLGESMTALTTGDDVLGASLRSGILSSMFHETDTTDDYIFVDAPDDVSGSGYDSPNGSADDMKQHQLLHPRAEELEEVLYSMAIWLLSHQVLGHIQEYLVMPGDTSNIMTTAHNPGVSAHFAQASTETEAAEKDKAEAKSSNEASFSDDSLLRELEEADCLNGNASLVAIAWRLGLDEEKLRSWALRHDKLRIFSRLAALGDDWGAV